MVCSGFIEPLNLQCLLVNTFAGNFEIFMAIAYIVISIGAAKFKMPGIIFLSMIVLFTAIMSAYIENTVYLLIVFVVAMVTFFSISKIATR